MGAILPTCVSPIVTERNAGSLFRVGFAEMNGWRRNMEDAHVVVMKDTWGFFGVFDGHGADKCSIFIQQRLTKELEEVGPPADDAAMKELMLRLDREFLATGQPGGSTGTFVLVTPSGDTGKHQLRVGNIGDSRVLLGRKDGSIFEGPGTDSGLTTDHKPDHPDEKERIDRTGGHVEVIQGCARVNGDLAVSRAFGDAAHKETGGPAQEDHPVSVDPELATFTCDASDFLVLVCDGISEAGLPNGDVVKLIADNLRADGDKVDPASAAVSVCRKALESGSKDNLSCMIVLLGGGELAGPKKALLSGPFTAPEHGSFRKAYEAMATHAGLTLAQAVELRYDDVRKERMEKVASNSATDGDDSLDSLRQELLAYGEGPPDDLKSGSEERTQWFKAWLDSHDVQEDPDPSSMTRQQLLAMLEDRPDLLAMAQVQGLVPMRVVKVAPTTQLQSAVEAIPQLKWCDELSTLSGQHGIVIYDDEMDGTSRVKLPNRGVFAWLPTVALFEEDIVDTNGQVVLVAPLEQVRSAIDANSALKWNEVYEKLCGTHGFVIQHDDEDGTTQVKFPEMNLVTWLPTCVLLDVDDEESEESADIEPDSPDSESTPKRQRTD